MLIDAESLDNDAVLKADVTVVGAGAAGIVIALELSRAGLEVNLIESGGPAYSPRVQALADAVKFDPAVHPPMNECTRRQLGGTSVIWGGRVVPFDPVDFDDRPHIPHSRWPIDYATLEPFFVRTCAYLHAGHPEFDIRKLPGVTQTSIVPGLSDGDVLSSTLERWSVMNFGRVYADGLKDAPRLKLFHGLTCTEIACPQGEDRVECIHARALSGKQVRLQSRRYVLAAGGLNTTRLLLASDRVHAGGIGNHSGMLGRFYTGHVSGRIAEVQFSTPPRATVFGFDRDAEGVYARRRFSFTRDFQHRAKLPNIVSWLVNSEISDPAHGNGILSFAYLILSSPLGKFLASEAIRKSAVKGEKHGSVASHVLNMVRDLPRTAVFIPTFGYKRYLAQRKVPGFFQYSRSNIYNLHYFGEGIPSPDSRVTLADERDEMGLRRLNIDLRYCEQDVRGVLDAHRHWDEHLRRNNCGQLRYIAGDLEQSIRDQVGDGFHQVGTTRMSRHPSDGVVTPDCNVHGFDDLFIASSSTCVTASQANSMFQILALSLRIADRLKGELVARG
ncbi:MAG: GMC oxidoreductase [Phycisphaerales bacterium]